MVETIQLGNGITQNVDKIMDFKCFIKKKILPKLGLALKSEYDYLAKEVIQLRHDVCSLEIYALRYQAEIEDLKNPENSVENWKRHTELKNNIQKSLEGDLNKDKSILQGCK